MIMSKISDIVLNAFSVVLVTLILGSYGFTWLVDVNQTQEKTQWRDKHVQEHKQTINEIKVELKQDIKDLKEELNKSQDEMKDMLEKIIRLQEQTRRSSR
jgi:uncharacterized protein HemX